MFWCLYSILGTMALHSSTGEAIVYRSLRHVRDDPDTCYLKGIAMFSDPQSITVSGAAKSLPRVSVEGSSTVYSTDDGAFVMRVSHTKNKRKRSMIRVEQKKVAADPLLAERNVETNQTAYLVLDAPLNGLYTSTEQKALIDALIGALQASTGALTTKFVAGES